MPGGPEGMGGMGGMGGMPEGFSFRSGGGGPGMRGFSFTPSSADDIFSQFFGGRNPFASMGGMGGMGGMPRGGSSRMGGMGGMPGFGFDSGSDEEDYSVSNFI